MPHNVMPTLNDDAMIGALFFLTEFWQEALDNPGLDQQVYLDGIRLNVQYLIDVFDLNAHEGRGSWASQYWLSDGSDMAGRPTWGRAMEPPAFTFNTAHADEFLVKWHSLETDEALKGEIERVLTGHFLYWKYEAAPVNSRLEWIEALSDCPYLSSSMQNYDPDDVRTWYWWLWYNHDASAVDRFGDPVPLNAFVSASSKITEGINDEFYRTYYGDDALVWGHYNTSSYPMIRSIGAKMHLMLVEDGQGGASVDLLDGAGGQHDRTLSHYFNLDTENRLFKTGEYSETLLSLALTELDQDTGFFLAKEGFVGGQTRTYVQDWSFSSRMCRLAWGVGNTEGEVIDSDGDGWSDVEEGAAGTDTHDSASYPGDGQHSPVAEDDAFETPEDTTLVTGSVLVNDTDEDGDELSVASVTQPQHGTVLDNGDGTLTYTPVADWFGADTFSYTVSDGHGGTDTATVTITVTGVNDDPSAISDGYGVDADGFLAIAAPGLLANDTDPDTGDTLAVTGVDTSGTVGSVTWNADGSFTYDPNGQFDSLGVGETSADTFTYTVADGNGGTDTVTVTLTVTGVNDDPDAVDDTYGVAEGSLLSVLASGVLENDSDPDSGDALAVLSVDTSGTSGSVSWNADGSFTYDPNGSFDSLGSGDSATDTFTYTVSDGQGGTDTATVTVTVTGVNDDPAATDDDYDTNEDSLLSIAAMGLLANDSDPDAGETLTVQSVNPSGALGSVTWNADGSFTYDPNGQFESLAAGETSGDSFSYTVADGNGGTDTAVVTVTITGVNDAPSAASDRKVLGTYESLVFESSDLLDNDTDVDGDTLTVSSVSATAGTHGTVSLDAGTITYTPDAGYDGEASFEYTVSDGHGGEDVGTVTVGGTTVGIGGDDPSRVDYTDADGDHVTIWLRGPGSGVLLFPIGENPDVADIRLQDTTRRSSLIIGVRQAEEGTGETTVDSIYVQGSMRSIRAKDVDLLGDVIVDGTLGKLVLDDIADDHRISINDAGQDVGPRDRVIIVADMVSDTAVDTHGVAIQTLKATQWVNEDGSQIVAPWIGRLAVPGRAAKPRWGIEAVPGQFQADLVLNGGNPLGFAIGRAWIAGEVSGNWNLASGGAAFIRGDTMASTWSLQANGTVRNIRAAALAGALSADTFGQIRVNGSLAADIQANEANGRDVSLGVLRADSIQDTSLDLAGGIGSLVATEWLDTDATADQVRAGWIGRLVSRGRLAQPRRGVAASDGNFQAQLTLDGVNGRGLALGSARIAGQLNSDWSISAGNAGVVVLGATATDWTLTAAGAVNRLVATGSLTGDVSAHHFRRIVTRGDLTGIILATGTDALGRSIGSLWANTAREVSVTAAGGIGAIRVRQWASDDGFVDTIEATWLGSLTARGKQAVSQQGVAALPGDFEADVVLTGTQGRASLGRASIAGSLANQQWRIDGDVQAIHIGGEVSNWMLRGHDEGLQTLQSLSLGDVASADVTVADALGIAKAQRWADGRLEADSIGFLNVTGHPGNASAGVSPVSGDFGAELIANATNVSNGGKAVGKVVVSGDLDASVWRVAGDVGELTVVGSAKNSAVRARGSVGKIAVGATDASDFLAGVDEQGAGRYTNAAGDFVNAAATIGAVQIRGLKAPSVETPTEEPVGEPNRFFVDSNFSAARFGSIHLINVDFDTGDSGFHAAGGGGVPFQWISNVDRATGEAWSWSARHGTAIPAPSGFFELV